MKNTIRRLAGWLMALMMIFGSVIVPTGSGDRYALAEGDEGIANQLLQTGTEGEGEGEITEPNYVNLKRLYDLYYERSEILKAEEGLTEEELLPEIVLGEEWTALLPEDQALLRLLIDGAWEFVYDDLGVEVIGVQEHVFEIDIPTDAAEQTTPPPAQDGDDPAGDVPEVTFVDEDLVTNPPAVNDVVEGGDQVTNPPAANDVVEGGDQVTNPPAANDAVEGGDQVTNPPAANDVVEGGDQVTNPPAANDAVEGGDQVTNPPAVEDAGENETIPGAAEPVAEGSETYPVADEGTGTLEVEEDPVIDGSETLDVVIDGSETLDVEIIGSETLDVVIDGSETLEVVEDAATTGSETLNVPEDEVIDGSKTQDIVDEGKGGEEVPGAEPEVIPAGNEDKTEEAPKATGLKATRFTLKKAPALLQNAPDTNDGNGSDGQGNENNENDGNLRGDPAVEGTSGSYSYTITPSSIQYNAQAVSFTLELFEKDNPAIAVNITSVSTSGEGSEISGTVKGDNKAEFTIKASTEEPYGSRAKTYKVSVTAVNGDVIDNIPLTITPANYKSITTDTNPVDWTGNEIAPGDHFEVKATGNGGEFTVPQVDLNKEQIGSFSKIAVGTHKYTITCTNNNITGIPEGTSISYEVKYNLAKANVMLTPSSATYTGSSIEKPSIAVSVPATPATPGNVPPADYDVSYKKGNNEVTEIKEPGQYSVILTGKNDAYNSTSATFTVTASLTYELSNTSKTYNGSKQDPSISFKCGETPMELDSSDYTLTYRVNGTTDFLPEAKDAGVYDVKVTLMNSAYSLEESAVTSAGFEIQRVQLENPTIPVGSRTLRYKGSEYTDLLGQISFPGLIEGEEIPTGTIVRFLGPDDREYSNNPPKNVGDYKVSVWLPKTCKNYEFKYGHDGQGSARAGFRRARTLSDDDKFTITPVPLSYTLSPKSVVYNGENQSPAVTLTASDDVGTIPDELTSTITFKGTGATAYTSTAKEVGVYDVKVTLTNEYAITKNYSFPETAQVTTSGFEITANPITAAWNPTTGGEVTYDRQNWASVMLGRINVTPSSSTDTFNITYSVALEDGTPVDETTQIVNVDSYDLVITGTDDAHKGSTANLTFKINPAPVTATLTYEQATYNRENWFDAIGIHGDEDSGAVPTIALNVTTGALAHPDGSDSVLTLNTSEIEITNTEKDFTNAGAYDVKWDFKSTDIAKNFTVTTTEKTKAFKVVPAEVDAFALNWSTATYDRTDWADRIYLHGTTAPAKYPIEFTAHAKGVEGTVNADTVSLDLAASVSSEGTIGGDFTKLDKPEMINVGKYEVKATVSDNFTFDGKAGGTLTLPFTVVPAEVDEMALAYDNATYNRKDWAKNLYLYGGEETGEYPNVITGTAVGAAGTVNEKMEALVLSLPDDKKTVDGFVSFTAGEIIDADEYKEVIAVTVSGNYVTEGTDPDTYTLGFTVNPAEIDSAVLDYNRTFYDRHNWHGELLTFDQKKDEPVAYNNVVTIKTKPVKYGETVSDEVLTLNEKTEDMTAAADEYKIESGTITNAGSYSVEWSLKDTDNFVVAEARKDELQKLPFTVEQAEITSVTIQRDDGDAATSATVVYDGAEWRDRIGINSASGEHHSFIVKATTASKTVPGTDFVIGALTLTGSEYELSYPKLDPDGKMIRIGEYKVQEDLKDTRNFKYSAVLDLDGEKTGAAPYVQLPFTVTRYEAEPIRDTTSSVVGPSKDNVVKYKSVYHMGPEQSENARILTFTGEPGEEVIVTIGGEKVRTTFSGTKYTNYGGGSTTGKLTLKISSSGVVTIDRTSTTVKLTPNSDTTITLSYADAGNLKEGSEEKDPGTLSVKAHFDTIKPQIATAVDKFLNRDMTVSITVPEAGRLESISFDETISVESKDYVSESENYGATFKDTLDVPWNTEGTPHLIHSGKEAIEMKYTDLVYNTASAKFDIGQSTGAPIIITVEPIVSADKERIDMDEQPEQVKVTVEGTGYELMHLIFEPSKSDEAKDTATGTGAWARESTGEWSTIVETDAFANDYDITATAWYDDLVGQEVYTFFFDNVADPIILTVPEITEDNWVIPGIAESNSAVEIKVDGEKIVTKGDRFTLFTGRKPQLKAGSIVQIVATDLSNNRAKLELEVKPSPTDGMQTLDAYAMGKIYTNAHTEKEDPKWLMAGLYTEEELTNGVSVPLIAGSAFHIGEVQLKMEGGKLNSVFTPKEGVTLSGQKVTAQIATSRAFNMESFNAGEKKNAENAIGYWISAYVQAKIPVEMLHQTFQLDENQAEIRSFYFNRQRLESIPE